MSLNSKKVICIIQARMGSTRLPGKAFIKINGIPIDRVINRLKFSKRLDEIWIATTTKSEDKIFLSLEKKYNIKVFRGNIKNVLSRFEKIAILTKRITLLE